MDWRWPRRHSAWDWRTWNLWEIKTGPRFSRELAMRPVRIIAALMVAATVGMLAPVAPAWAASATTLQVSPGSVTAGDPVVVSGSVGPAPAGSACATSVLLLSRAFVPTTAFAGVPAVTAAVKPGGAFTTTTRIPRSTPAGTYTISGRCGGGNLGVSATLTVRARATTPAVALAGVVLALTFVPRRSTTSQGLEREDLAVS